MTTPALDHLVCRSCGRVLTRPVARLTEVPARRHRNEVETSYWPTMTPGTWAVDPEPCGRRPDDEPSDTPGCLVVSPDDAPDLETHPDPDRSSGCCGHDGLDGPNRRCPQCHAEVATLRDDCWTVVELRFEPAAVLAVPAD